MEDEVCLGWVHDIRSMVDMNFIEDDDVDGMSFLIELQFYMDFKNNGDWNNMVISCMVLKDLGKRIIEKIEPYFYDQFVLSHKELDNNLKKAYC